MKIPQTVLDDAFKGSYQHANSPSMLEHASRCLPEYLPTFQSGRSCGWHAAIYWLWNYLADKAPKWNSDAAMKEAEIRWGWDGSYNHKFVEGVEWEAKATRVLFARLEVENKQLRKKLEQALACFDSRQRESARDLCALMAEGEGNDPETYRRMARSAMVQMDEVRTKVLEDL